jgi:hypothetical protein
LPQLNDITWEIIVIDDSSPYGTWEVAQKLAKLYGEGIRLIKREGKLGLVSKPTSDLISRELPMPEAVKWLWEN